MHNSIIVVFLIHSMFILSWAISSSAYAANACLSCHGNADKLKTMIHDEDYNKSSGEAFG